MRRLRVAVLCHEELIPPDNFERMPLKEREPWKREWGVGDALRVLGHDVRFLGVAHDLVPIRETVHRWKPHVVFNLLNEFQDVAAYQVHVTSYLELLHVAYTGCNPTGLALSRDKAVSKKILRYHRLPTPGFRVYRRGRRVPAAARHRFPMIVKSLIEEASYGISQASVVRSERQLAERVEFVHDSIGSDAIVEEYVEGRELTISILGNRRLVTFPIWEMYFDNLPEGSEPIATEHAKWNLAYQKRVGIHTGRAKRLSPEIRARIERLARRVYRVLELSGFARLDLRLSEDGRVYVLEANAAPDLSFDEDFALSAEAGGLDYESLIQRILNLALRYRPPWRQLGAPQE